MAVSLSNSVTQSITRDNGSVLTYTVTDSGTDRQEIYLPITVPASSTNYEVTIAFPYARLKFFHLSNSAAVTIKTNSSGSPDNTLTISAAGVNQWRSGLGNLFSNPFSADVTKFYITTTPGADLVIYVVYDSTP